MDKKTIWDKKRRVCSLSLWEERLRVLRPRETLVVGERRHCQCGWGLSQERRETKSLESKMCHILADDPEIGVREAFDKWTEGSFPPRGRVATIGVRSRWRHWGLRGGCQWLQCRGTHVYINSSRRVWDCTFGHLYLDIYGNHIYWYLILIFGTPIYISTHSNQRVWDETISHSQYKWSDAHFVPPTCITLFKARCSQWLSRQKVTAKKSFPTFWGFFGKDRPHKKYYQKVIRIHNRKY